MIIYSAKWCHNWEKLNKIKIKKCLNRALRNTVWQIYEVAVYSPKRGGGTLIAWSTWKYTGKKNVKKSWKMSVPELAEEWIDLFLLLFCE